MNAAQRAILKVVLVIEGLLILRPPFREGAGFSAHDMGHHWFFYPSAGNIDFATLAYVSTPERNRIGGRSKNTSQAEMAGWPCSAQ